jgi:hypothetical protein
VGQLPPAGNDLPTANVRPFSDVILSPTRMEAPCQKEKCEGCASCYSGVVSSASGSALQL